MENAVILRYNKELMWQSDWDGEDVGHDDVNVVGLYKLSGTNTYFYIDMETNQILEVLIDLFAEEEY